MVVWGWQRCALLGANCVRLTVCGVGMADPAETLDHVAEELQERLAIRIHEEDALPRVAAARNVEPRRSRSRHVNSRNRGRLPSCFPVKQPSIAWRSCHGLSLAHATHEVKI
jgi:hypothetical protein